MAVSDVPLSLLYSLGYAMILQRTLMGGNRSKLGLGGYTGSIAGPKFALRTSLTAWIVDGSGIM